MSSDKQPPSDQPNPNIRVSNAEREEIIAILHRSTEAGRLDLTEFNERAQAVYEAKTYGELHDLLEDLPEGSTSAAPNAPVVKETNLDPSRLSTLTLKPRASSVHKKGQWRVPAEIRSSSIWSDVTLDFSNAVITTPVVDIIVADTLSDLWIILPDNDGHAVDDIKLRAASVENECESVAAGGVRFNIKGKLVISSLRIRRVSSSSWEDD